MGRPQMDGPAKAELITIVVGKPHMNGPASSTMSSKGFLRKRTNLQGTMTFWYQAPPLQRPEVTAAAKSSSPCDRMQGWIHGSLGAERSGGATRLWCWAGGPGEQDVPQQLGGAGGGTGAQGLGQYTDEPWHDHLGWEGRMNHQA